MKKADAIVDFKGKRISITDENGQKGSIPFSELSIKNRIRLKVLPLLLQLRGGLKSTTVS